MLNTVAPVKHSWSVTIIIESCYSIESAIGVSSLWVFPGQRVIFLLVLQWWALWRCSTYVYWMNEWMNNSWSTSLPENPTFWLLKCCFWGFPWMSHPDGTLIAHPNKGILSLPPRSARGTTALPTLMKEFLRSLSQAQRLARMTQLSGPLAETPSGSLSSIPVN